jgi:hypothetical protein
MILGRAAALWAGLLGAVLNVVGLVVVVATNTALDANMVALFAGLNGLGLAVIGIIANVTTTGSFFGRSGDRWGR